MLGIEWTRDIHSSSKLFFDVSIVLYAEKKIRDMSLLLKDEFLDAKQKLQELELEIAERRIMSL